MFMRHLHHILIYRVVFAIDASARRVKIIQTTGHSPVIFRAGAFTDQLTELRQPGHHFQKKLRLPSLQAHCFIQRPLG
jgi:hypothetical protein